ncbi:type II secretion system protein E (GspE) [Desulfonispora thiosulfatigenes DSM 11270]|uniref:Type II secretion system protein E (GspE) n=1 Tax=Desulfonispora thiosulfatigenes DSM 11270 TaxID=656914 RepID=A0A1W1VNK8_DESTI|nr:GspE/PulE family protein [Desulfonispora thiosulfatigenes]SMB94952.1 type II secretion system protein E (GspE) [Desulfonispora thiosulfatigenes DSM 11270]
MEKRKRLGDLLVSAGLILPEQLQDAIKLQKNTGKKLGEILVDENIIDEKDIIKTLEVQLGIPYINLERYYINPEVPRLINENLARRYLLVPVKKSNNKLTVVMADPLNIFAIDDVSIATGLEVIIAISSKQEILNAIDYYYGTESAEKAVADFKNQYDIDNLTDINDEVLSEINNAPVVRLVNSIIKQAIKTKASDIHIEPYEKNVRVRFRIDGQLQEIMAPEKSTHSPIITRIKIMGKMNIAEKRVPQDGRLETNVDGRDIDLRISTLPTSYGEKVVMRLLDRSTFLMSKSKIGFSDQNLEIFNRIIQKPSGIILVTGPTGSGKTTTLYSILRELNSEQKNIVTVEDPIEYNLEGINQVQVNLKANLTFANVLRSILRQDPDIIMIGEIRDEKTAQIAIRAAITGHLVLSTMHTNDSPSTVVRLVDMGIRPYLVSSSVFGVISQRLVRKICPECKKSYFPDEIERKLLSIDEKTPLYKGEGCSYCNYTGYKGRTAVHEIMAVNKEIRLEIDQNKSIDLLKQTAIEQGMIPLKENCIQLVLEGITTVEELINVSYNLD